MFSLPLTLTIQPSRRLRLGLTALHGMAMMAVWLTLLPAALQSLLSLGLLVSCWQTTRPGKPINLRCQQDGQISVQENAAWQPAELSSRHTWLPFLVLLHYRMGSHGALRHLSILTDCLPPEDFRRLRVWLKWLARSASTPGPAS